MNDLSVKQNLVFNHNESNTLQYKYIFKKTNINKL